MSTLIDALNKSIEINRDCVLKSTREVIIDKVKELTNFDIFCNQITIMGNQIFMMEALKELIENGGDHTSR